jgi:hypothetical protein
MCVEGGLSSEFHVKGMFCLWNRSRRSWMGVGGCVLVVCVVAMDGMLSS